MSILPVDLRVSQSSVSVEGKDIQLGLNYVHGFGAEQIEVIETARQRGQIDSLADLVQRTRLNRPHIEALAQHERLLQPLAAHIIRQRQFNALCATRGWKNKLRLMVDDSYPPATRLMPEWGLRAKFWIEAIGDNYGTDTNELGTYLYLATDQVRFYAIDARQHYAHASGGGYHPDRYGLGAPTEPIILDNIPPLVLSEIMRDVDLFVLGSGNILMEPNDQYLCIVPGRSAVGEGQTGKVFLPFEEDNTLAIILSKAFLLAEDTKIKAPTITRQIGHSAARA